MFHRLQITGITLWKQITREPVTSHPSQVRLLATNKTIQKIRERTIEFLMFLCALSSVAITLGIVGILLFESWNFFKHVSLFDFLTDTQWTVLFENPRYGSCHWSRARL